MKTIRKYPTGGLAFLLACAFAAEGRAAVFGAVATNGDGTFSYSYTVDNTRGSFDVAAWSLEFDVVPDWGQDDSGLGGDVTVPLGWIAAAGIPLAGIAAQDFLSFDPPADVLTGQTLPGFAFTSAHPPGSVSYFEFSASGDSVSGGVLGPVPEPEEAMLFAGAGIGAWLAGRRWFKHRTAWR